MLTNVSISLTEDFHFVKPISLWYSADRIIQVIHNGLEEGQ